jgi:hypothetical protein
MWFSVYRSQSPSARGKASPRNPRHGEVRLPAFTTVPGDA